MTQDYAIKAHENKLKSLNEREQKYLKEVFEPAWVEKGYGGIG